MKRKQNSHGGKNHVPEEILASPNFDLIYEFSVAQKKILMRIQTHLTQMMKDSKANFETWKKDEARKAKEIEDAKLIRLGLKELDDDDDDNEAEEEEENDGNKNVEKAKQFESEGDSEKKKMSSSMSENEIESEIA